MSETRWTPGPWAWQRDPMLYGEDFVGVYADAATGDHLRCQVLGGNHDADAALMAAAPDLYDALADVVAFLDGTTDEGVFGIHSAMEADAIDYMRAGQAALARARGEEG